MQVDESDPIYKHISKIPLDIKEHVEIVAQDTWRKERFKIIQELSTILNISVTELDTNLANLPNKKGRPLKRKNKLNKMNFAN